VLPVLLVLGCLEGAAWIADARWHFREKLLDAYGLMVVENQPIRVPEDLPWPEGTVAVRSATGRRRTHESYTIAGRVIPDADPSTDVEWLRPQGTVRPSEKRIFVLGGSSAFGFPYRYDDTFAGILGRRLGEHGYRVLNASRVGTTSAGLVPVSSRIINRYDPKFLVIFTGNNEWIHWAPENQPRIDRTRLRLLQVLAYSRALAWMEYRLLRRLVERSAKPDAPEDFAMHKEISGHSYALRYPMGDDIFDPRRWLVNRQRYLDSFEANLSRMVRDAQDRHVQVVLLTVPFNYKLSPAWKHPQPESFGPKNTESVRRAIRAADRLLKDGKPEEALPLVVETLAQDPLSPMLNYLHGECLETMGRPLEAEAAYARCRENMVGNLGGVLSVNEVIARVAGKTGAELLDVRRLFDEYGHARGSYFNENVVHDDCHPTPLGHQLIADALLELLFEESSEALSEVK